MNHLTDRRALILILLATFGLAFKGIFVRFSYEVGMTIAAVLMWRIILATPLYWGIVLMSKKEKWRFNKKVILQALLCGNFFAIATISDFQALALMDVGVSRAILFTFPLFVQILALIHSRRVPNQREILAFIVCYSGLLLMLDLIDVQAAAIPWEGALYSLVAAISYGAFLFYGKQLTEQLGAALFTSLANMMSLFWVIIYLLVFSQANDFHFSLQGIGWISLMVVFSTVLPFILLFEGMKKLGAEQSSMIALLGPIISLSAAAAWLNEAISLTQLFGFALVLLGVAHLQGLLSLKKIRRSAPK
ncbi:MAG: DMT family transporter [Oceanospirillaceae bacterium]